MPSPAHQLYIGPYFTALMQYARSRAGLADIYILSAKYGIVPAMQVIPPYEQSFGTPGSVNAATLRVQANQLGLTDRDVIVLAGKRYLAEALRVWTHERVTAPLQRVQGGMGAQISWLRRSARQTP